MADKKMGDQGHRKLNMVKAEKHQHYDDRQLIAHPSPSGLNEFQD